MKHLEVFSWRIRGSGGREAITHMTFEDGRAMGAELLKSMPVHVEVPETPEEILESWMTGKTFRVVADPVELRRAA